MARRTQVAEEEARAQLFGRLVDARSEIVAVVVHDTGIPADRLAFGFDRIIELVADPVASPEQLARWRAEGAQMARTGVTAERVLDGLLSLNWAIWERAMRQSDIVHAVVIDLADRLMRGLDDGVAAITEGFLQAEVEMAAAHSDLRRGVLDELLTAPRLTPEDRARIRLRAERHGVDADGVYRLILVTAPDLVEPGVAEAVDRLEKRIRVPTPHHRTRPGIRLPVVLDWRGRVLVFARADWTGDGRLREALPLVIGDGYLSVDSGRIAGCEALAQALAVVEYAAGIAESLGRSGWIGHPGHLALETTFLLDDTLVREAIEQELGPLLADPRMGEELVETLEVYLGARQNTREAARRLHLAPRTVAYRLERIETLLGHELDGDAIVRLSAALLALRVSRQAGRA